MIELESMPLPSTTTSSQVKMIDDAVIQSSVPAVSPNFGRAYLIFLLQQQQIGHSSSIAKNLDPLFSPKRCEIRGECHPTAMPGLNYFEVRNLSTKIPTTSQSRMREGLSPSLSVCGDARSTLYRFILFTSSTTKLAPFSDVVAFAAVLI